MSVVPRENSRPVVSLPLAGFYNIMMTNYDTIPSEFVCPFESNRDIISELQYNHGT
jgi:hypothetical protein